MSELKVFICTDHDGHFPVGVCSVVVAFTEDNAREMLQTELKEHGLDERKPFTFRRLSISNPGAFVLLDGDY